MEIQQYNIKKTIIERTMLKHSDMESEYSPGKTMSWSMFPDKQLQAKYECKKIIKDNSTVWREVCVQQAVILISQVYLTMVSQKRVFHYPIYPSLVSSHPEQWLDCIIWTVFSYFILQHYTFAVHIYM